MVQAMGDIALLRCLLMMREGCAQPSVQDQKLLNVPVCCKVCKAPIKLLFAHTHSTCELHFTACIICEAGLTDD